MSYQRKTNDCGLCGRRVPCTLAMVNVGNPHKKGIWCFDCFTAWKYRGVSKANCKKRNWWPKKKKN